MSENQSSNKVMQTLACGYHEKALPSFLQFMLISGYVHSYSADNLDTAS